MKKEVERRSNRFRVMAENKVTISKEYKPKHKELFDDSKLPVKDVEEKTKISEGIYTFPLLDEALCNKLVEEVANFKEAGLVHSRATSMNKHGVILEEAGLGKVVEAVREKVEELAR